MASPFSRPARPSTAEVALSYRAAVARTLISTGTPWEPVVGYSRLVRVDRQIFVTGTTATLPAGGHAGEGDAYAQALQALRNIESALAQVGAGLSHIVRTRLLLTDIRRDWQAVGRAHAELLGAVRPATTMFEVSRLIEDWMLVEIEADALVD
jgi:enamine deaminase RidA (YjgF/YER057c/UK114 family)